MVGKNWFGSSFERILQQTVWLTEWIWAARAHKNLYVQLSYLVQFRRILGTVILGQLNP